MTLREECIGAAAMAMWDSDYPEASQNSRREAWLNYNLSYVSHATAAFDAIIERLRDPDGPMINAGEAVVRGYEDMRSARSVWEAMLAPLTQSGTQSP